MDVANALVFILSNERGKYNIYRVDTWNSSENPSMFIFITWSRRVSTASTASSSSSDFFLGILS